MADNMSEDVELGDGGIEGTRTADNQNDYAERESRAVTVLSDIAAYAFANTKRRHEFIRELNAPEKRIDMRNILVDTIVWHQRHTARGGFAYQVKHHQHGSESRQNADETMVSTINVGECPSSSYKLVWFVGNLLTAYRQFTGTHSKTWHETNKLPIAERPLRVLAVTALTGLIYFVTGSPGFGISGFGVRIGFFFFALFQGTIGMVAIESCTQRVSVCTLYDCRRIMNLFIGSDTVYEESLSALSRCLYSCANAEMVRDMLMREVKAASHDPTPVFDTLIQLDDSKVEENMDLGGVARYIIRCYKHGLEEFVPEHYSNALIAWCIRITSFWSLTLTVYTPITVYYLYPELKHNATGAVVIVWSAISPIVLISSLIWNSYGSKAGVNKARKAKRRQFVHSYFHYHEKQIFKPMSPLVDKNKRWRQLITPVVCNGRTDMSTSTPHRSNINNRPGV